MHTAAAIERESNEKINHGLGAVRGLLTQHAQGHRLHRPYCLNQVQWHEWPVPVLKTLKRWRPKGRKFKAILSRRSTLLAEASVWLSLSMPVPFVPWTEKELPRKSSCVSL